MEEMRDAKDSRNNLVQFFHLRSEVTYPRSLNGQWQSRNCNCFQAQSFLNTCRIQIIHYPWRERNRQSVLNPECGGFSLFCGTYYLFFSLYPMSHSVFQGSSNRYHLLKKVNSPLPCISTVREFPETPIVIDPHFECLGCTFQEMIC